MGGTSGTPYSAAEAVSPGGMPPAEWNAIPGAKGGEVGTGIDWGKLLGAVSRSLASGASAMSGSTNYAIPKSSGSSGGSYDTSTTPLVFQNIAQILASLQGLGGKR